MHVEGQLTALELQPREIKEVTVTFEQAGETLYCCHELGQYTAGIVGTVIVEG